MNSIRQTRMGSKRMSRRDRHGQAQLLAPDLLLPKSPLVLAVPDSSSLIITHIIVAQILAPRDKNVLQTVCSVCWSGSFAARRRKRIFKAGGVPTNVVESAGYFRHRIWRVCYALDAR